MTRKAQKRKQLLARREFTRSSQTIGRQVKGCFRCKQELELSAINSEPSAACERSLIQTRARCIVASAPLGQRSLASEN
jgi:hypothetical protein